jgi:ribosomal protein L11 methyltransferase
LAERRYPALDLRYPQAPETARLRELLYAALDCFEPIAIQEHETADGWRVFFRSPEQRDAARTALVAEFGAQLAQAAAVDVDDEDWPARSQAGLKAVRAGRLVVAPPWDAQADGDDILIVIEPSMGFGTGHHATTRLCLELLQQLDVSGRRVIDAGTGSGVLAIAAVKLGAAAVVAVDHDPDALENARANALANSAAIDIREADLATLHLPPADLVLANLTGVVLQRFAPALRALVPPGGRLIVSGFGPWELADVVTALEATLVQQRADGDWCAALLTWAGAPLHQHADGS